MHTDGTRFVTHLKTGTMHLSLVALSLMELVMSMRYAGVKASSTDMTGPPGTSREGRLLGSTLLTSNLSVMHCKLPLSSQVRLATAAMHSGRGGLAVRNNRLTHNTS